MPGPDREAEESNRAPVASWKSEYDFHFHIRASAHPRVLASTFLLILVLPSNNVLLFSLLLLLTASVQFLSRQSHTSHVTYHSPHLSPQIDPNENTPLIPASDDVQFVALPPITSSSCLQIMRPLKASIATYHY